MSARIELLPIEADELMSEIQAQIDANESASTARIGAVQFFPPIRDVSEQMPKILSEENFCEKDYLFSNPNVAAAVQRGEFRSGFEHWISIGKQEGRSFQPTEFSELEYLELNPEVALAVQGGQFASGRDH